MLGTYSPAGLYRYSQIGTQPPPEGFNKVNWTLGGFRRNDSLEDLAQWRAVFMDTISHPNYVPDLAVPHGNAFRWAVRAGVDAGGCMD